MEHMITEGAGNAVRARRVREGTRTIGEVVDTTDQAITKLAGEAEEIAAFSKEIETQCHRLEEQVIEMATGFEYSSENFSEAKDRLGTLLSVSETLIELTALTGVETPDAHFIEAAQKTAGRLCQVLERAVARGEISLGDFFDDCYVLRIQPVDATN